MVFPAFILDMLDAKSVEHEHPLIDLELIDVQLAHKLHHFYRFPFHSFFNLFQRVFIVENSHQLVLQMRPELFSRLDELLGVKTQHEDPREQEERYDERIFLVVGLETLDHFFKKRVEHVANTIFFRRKDQETELAEDF